MKDVRVDELVATRQLPLVEPTRARPTILYAIVGALLIVALVGAWFASR